MDFAYLCSVKNTFFKNTLPLFIVLLYSYSTHGQELDSLVQAVKFQKDTARVNSLIVLGQKLRNIDKDSSLTTFEEAIASAKGIKYYNGQIKALRYRGITYGMNHAYADAISDFSEAVELGKTYGNPKETANAYNGLGIVYKAIGDYVTSLKYYNQSLIIYKKNGMKNGESTAYANLGVLYDLMGEYDNSYEYYTSAYKIDDSLQNLRSKNSLLVNIAVYHIKKRDYKRAISILQENSAYYNSTKSFNNLIPVYTNIGHTYKLMKVYDSTIHYSTKAIHLIQNESLNKYDATDAYYNRSVAFLYNGELNNALADANSNFELAKDLGFSSMMESYQLKAEINDSLGNYKAS